MLCFRSLSGREQRDIVSGVGNYMAGRVYSVLTFTVELKEVCGGHRYFTSHPLEYYEWFKNRLGEDGFNTLQGRVRITHPKPDKKLLTIYFKQKIKELANPFE